MEVSEEDPKSVDVDEGPGVERVIRVGGRTAQPVIAAMARVATRNRPATLALGRAAGVRPGRAGPGRGRILFDRRSAQPGNSGHAVGSTSTNRAAIRIAANAPGVRRQMRRGGSADRYAPEAVGVAATLFVRAPAWRNGSAPWSCGATIGTDTVASKRHIEHSADLPDHGRDGLQGRRGVGRGRTVHEALHDRRGPRFEEWRSGPAWSRRAGADDIVQRRRVILAQRAQGR